MKAICLLIAFAISIHAATLEWDANPPEENIQRYHVWTQAGTNAWTLLGTATNATSMAIPTPTNRVRFAVSAVNADGFESERSAPLEFIPPTPPKSAPRIRLTLQSADSPTGPWTDQTNAVIAAALPFSGFYRGKMEIER